jgi:galactokinase
MSARRVTAFGPGRVNLIGEHTDYNGGLALPFAIAQGVTVTAERAEGDELFVRAGDLGEEDSFVAAAPEPARGWRAFARGVAAELAAAGFRVPSARLEVAGDVPRGAGLSSSAALEVALVLALLVLEGAEDGDRMDLARLCSRVENDWVGAQTGLLDQTASLLGRAGHALAIDFATMDVRPVPFDTGDWTLVVVDSGETHAHAEGGYNERRAECARAAELLGVERLAAAEEGAAAWLAEPLDRRARHVLTEDQRVRDTIAALGDGDLERVGALLDASHASLRDDFDASTGAVEDTVDRMKEAGAAGARMMGGGFGGSVLALFAPGGDLPSGATVVEPADGARLLGRG